MSAQGFDPRTAQVIVASLGRHYSGINASMWAVTPALQKRLPIVGFGFHLPPSLPRLRWWELFRIRRDRWRVWHARRNRDMLVGLILRWLLGFRLKLLFTSAAQRQHTWITRFYYHHMDAVIATSTAAAAVLDRPAVVVHHGVNVEHFRPPPDKQAAWRATGRPGLYGLGVFGRIRPSKGSEDFVDALITVLPQRPDWSAVFVGGTSGRHRAFERRLRKKLAAAGLAQRVHFTGFIPSAEVIRWYQALSVVVCPSRAEGFGLPCLEAMACGCPVVATRTGAWPEIVQDGRTGYLVNCGDVKALSAALLAITAKPERIAEMGEAARRWVVENFSIEREAAGILAVYKDLLRAALPVQTASHTHAQRL